MIRIPTLSNVKGRSDPMIISKCDPQPFQLIDDALLAVTGGLFS